MRSWKGATQSVDRSFLIGRISECDSIVPGDGAAGVAARGHLLALHVHPVHQELVALPGQGLQLGRAHGQVAELLPPVRHLPPCWRGLMPRSSSARGHPPPCWDDTEDEPQIWEQVLEHT